MRLVVAQIGARRSYAVPTILEQAGLLDRFYTDLAGNVGLGRWLTRCGPLLGFRSAARKLATRCVPDCIRAKTTTFAGPGFWYALNRALCRPDPSARFREQLRWSRHLGRLMIRRGFGQATHFYSMLGETGPLLREARRRNLTTVTEIYIQLSTEKIIRREQDLFPDWEPALPDFNPIRRDFEDDTVLARTDYALCPTEVVRRDLFDNFGFAAERAAVVPYGIPESWLLMRSQPVIGRILFVGTACLRKGIHYLAMAAEQLHNKGRAYDFRVAGDVLAETLRHPECRHLHFLGRIGRDRIAEEYARADLFVLPSLAEGSAESAYQALAAGVPVVATAAAGTVVREGIDGRIVPERDPAKLAQAIEAIVEKRLLRATMSASARQRAREFTLPAYGQRLVSALSAFGA